MALSELSESEIEVICAIFSFSRSLCIYERLLCCLLIASEPSKTHGQRYEILICTDSMQLFDALTEGKRTEEHQLMVDILAAVQLYKRSEITGISFIRANDNPADSIANLMYNGLLKVLLKSGMTMRNGERWLFGSQVISMRACRKKARSENIYRKLLVYG